MITMRNIASLVTAFAVYGGQSIAGLRILTLPHAHVASLAIANVPAGSLLERAV